MKKEILLFMSVLCTAILVDAQDITTYRGAFAPAPDRQWTESWTNFNPQLTAYGTATVPVSGHITSNTTWTSNNVYLLQGLVYVDTLVTLTIEPGTVIRGDENTANSSLLIRRGGKLMAEGTQCSPIVFTSNKPTNQRALGDWGGVILLGRAKHNLGIQNLIEGLDGQDLSNYHGGTDDEDNSGVLKYVRIEYGGFQFQPNNEINGLTMGSVGRGTVIDYVQVSFVNDDAFEWFGGTVNAKHLVAFKCLDDDFDTDNGYSGTVQYALGIKDPAVADNPAAPVNSTSEGFESDNDNPGTNQARQPKTSAKFYNVTQIGAFRCASNAAASGITPTAPSLGFRRGARIRRNSDLKIYNSILMNNWRGLFIDGALALANTDQDSLAFRNNIIAGDFTTTWTGGTYGGTKSLAAEDQNTRTRLFNVNYSNDSINTCSLLTDPWNATASLADFRPNTTGDGALATANLQTVPDLNPSIDIDNNLFNANQAYDFVVNLFELGGGSTSGTIEIVISKTSGWNVTVPGLTLSGTNQAGVNGSSNVFGGTSNFNGDWLFREDANNVYITSKVGLVLPIGGFSAIGLTATRKAGTSSGTNQSLVLSISTGSGGDQSDPNNGAVIGLSAN